MGLFSFSKNTSLTNIPFYLYLTINTAFKRVGNLSAVITNTAMLIDYD